MNKPSVPPEHDSVTEPFYGLTMVSSGKASPEVPILTIAMGFYNVSPTRSLSALHTIACHPL